MSLLQQTATHTRVKRGSSTGGIHLTEMQVAEVAAAEMQSIHQRVAQSARTGSEEVVRTLIFARAERRKFLPTALLAEPAWDMLLDLYLADIMSQRVSVSSLCAASNVPATTALRWIAALASEGLADRKADPFDGRRVFVSLSPAGLIRMDDYFRSLARRTKPH